MDAETIECTFAIVGSGIAGVSCAKGLNIFAPEEKTVLISASPLIKTVTNVIPLGKTLMQFDIAEENAATLSEVHTSVEVIHDTVVKVNSENKIIETENGKRINYKMICLCNGARPKVIAENNNFVIGIRDTESVMQFSKKLEKAKRIIVVGNGGIATEIIHEIKGIEIIWVIKDKHISATFVDPGAAEFFFESIYKTDSSTDPSKNVLSKRMRYTTSNDTVSKDGPALGPDWHNNFDIKRVLSKNGKIDIEYECEVVKIFSACEKSEFSPTEECPVYVELSNGKIIGCDLIVSATGVIPNSDLSGLEDLEKAEDGGFLVDWKLETSKKDIYAAGDVCTAGWELAKHWFQMRLWTQAHQMGYYAAKSMSSNLKRKDFMQDFCFELFTHVTKFFGYKVVLLGLYNSQKLNNNYEILLRMDKGKEYIKIILEDGKMQGAVLIGETDLEEMCENLILNQLDLSMYGEDLLNPNIDIEDYFD